MPARARRLPRTRAAAASRPKEKAQARKSPGRNSASASRPSCRCVRREKTWPPALSRAGIRRRASKLCFRKALKTPAAWRTNAFSLRAQRSSAACTSKASTASRSGFSLRMRPSIACSSPTLGAAPRSLKSAAATPTCARFFRRLSAAPSSAAPAVYSYTTRSTKKSSR